MGVSLSVWRVIEFFSWNLKLFADISAMKGKVLHYDMTKSEGLISGEDGQRYRFISSEWKEPSVPLKGMDLEFLVDGSDAEEIYLSAYRSGFSVIDKDWYKSIDDKVLAGVCSGLAHKFDVSPLALRLVTVLLSLFLLFPILLYIVLWLILPFRATR